MDLSDAPPIDVVPMMPGERAQLLELLDSLEPEQWAQPTAAPGWTVKDIALHLVDDDLSVLARNRDGDASGFIDADTHEDLVEGLAAKNQKWIDGAQRLSPRVITDLLAWSGEQVAQYYTTVPATEQGHVSWACDQPVPVWLDIAREFTERWVHQVQIREAVGRSDNYTAEHLPAVLRTFVWAFPHQYRAEAEPGTTVRLDLDSGGVWTLTCEGGQMWSLSEGGTGSADATARFTDNCGWRVLTGAQYSQNELAFEGRADLCQPLLAARSIIV